MTLLNSAQLGELDASVAVPGYDRSAVTAGIVHFGVGAFHRSHQAMYLDTLMNAGQALDWGICGVGLLPADEKTQAAMTAQDCLYTLVLKGSDGAWTPRVIGSIVDYRYAPHDPEAVLELMSSPAIRIVSLTITEGGYTVGPDTGAAEPVTVFGYISQALARRRAAGVAPFTVVSCDNIQSNGEVTRAAVLAQARRLDLELASWIETSVRFPNSMVDRITPATTDADRAEIAERFGIADACPVLCEPFTQWVLEDSFTDGRPPLHEVGVQLVADVEPYELMKLRLLNAGHQAMCYAGYLAGHRLVHDVAQDELFSRFLLQYMRDEAMPSLSPVPGIDLDDYALTLISRFSNAEVRDTVARLCSNSSDLIPKFILPVLSHQLATGGDFTCCAAVIAAWARYDEGVDEQGEPIAVKDVLAAQLTASAKRQRCQPTAFLENREIFGDLIDNPAFTAVYSPIVTRLHQYGVRSTLQWVTGDAT